MEGVRDGGADGVKFGRGAGKGPSKPVRENVVAAVSYKTYVLVAQLESPIP